MAGVVHFMNVAFTSCCCVSVSYLATPNCPKVAYVLRVPDSVVRWVLSSCCKERSLSPSAYLVAIPPS